MTSRSPDKTSVSDLRADASRDSRDLSARFVCFAKCAASGEKNYPLTQAIYRCPDCGGLLAVRHDMKALAQTSAAEWKKRFDERFRVGAYPLASGVWGKKEWVAPELPEDDIVSTMEGATPLSMNGYKVQLFPVAIYRTVLLAAGQMGRDPSAAG